MDNNSTYGDMETDGQRSAWDLGQDGQHPTASTPPRPPISSRKEITLISLIPNLAGLSMHATYLSPNTSREQQHEEI